MQWNRVTEKPPIEGKDYLVWTGYCMIVATAEYYNIEEMLNHYEPELVQEITSSKGYFAEIGEKHYFDNPRVFWAELPEGPK